jgi:polyhydroxybutyrate depolymerase
VKSPNTVYVCQSCGAQARKWLGRCPDCGEWNSLVEEAAAHVTPDGVYLVGLSNGAFMSYRMACESMPGLRGIVPVGGADFDDPARCEGARPLSVLHIHGTGDVVIGYHGGSSEAGTAYPAAEEAVRRWASRAGCDLGAAEMLEPLDLDFTLSGAETQPLRYRRGCRAGVTVELWTIEGGAHVPAFDPDDIGERILAWLLD